MIPCGGRPSGRIPPAAMVVVVVVVGVALFVGGAADARPVTGSPGALGAEITLPPVTVPPVTVPPVTVPQLPTDDRLPGVGQVIDGVGDTVDGVVGVVGGVTGALPDGGQSPVVTMPPSPSAGPTAQDDPDPGGRGDSTDGAGAAAGSGRRGSSGGDAAASTTGARGRGGRGGAGDAGPADAAAGRSPAAADAPVPPIDSVDDAVREDARRFGWPLLIGALIVGFLTFQHRADRHERKLADAPLDQGERLRFR